MLFRSEANHGRDRLHGDVSLAPPLSWQLLGMFLAGILVVLLLFLSLASYGRRVTALGQIEGDRGVVRVVPARGGVLSRLFVREGDIVRAGQPLARVDFRTVSGAGELEQRRSAAIRDEALALAVRMPALLQASQARLAALTSQMQGQHAEIDELDPQIAEQQDLIRSAQEDLDRARAVAANGFVSRNDIRVREQTLAERRQGLLRLRRERAGLLAQLAQGEADVLREHADYEVSRADAARARGEVAAAAADDAAQPWIYVTAPVAGRVTGVTPMPGARVDADRPLLSLVPAGTKLFARLEIPAPGVGFVRPGQRVAIALNAFPRETFGTLSARITYVTMASIPDEARAEPLFMADAMLDHADVRAYGSHYSLRPGMTLSATVTTRRMSLIRWLLDPLYAVTTR